METPYVWRGAAAVMVRAAVACSVCISVTVGCARGPIELGFWVEPVSYASPRLGDPISGTELAAIEALAHAEIATAFERFNVVVSGNRQARYHVRVVQRLFDQRFRSREVSIAGESRGAARLGGSGAVSFDFLAGSAMVYAPEDVDRAELIAAIGRGIGRSAVHEFAHQLLPSTPIHDSRDRASYEFESAARMEQYFGDMRWAVAQPLLEDRLGLR